MEARRFFSGDDGVLIDSGYVFEQRDDGLAAAMQINDRWSSTASGSVGSTGQGLTLTWSIVPDGTTLTSYYSGESTAGSDLQARLDSLYGSSLTWMPIIQSIFDSWSGISGLTFVQSNDDGVAYASTNSGRGVSGTRGDLRLGSHTINGASGTLAYNWYPDYGEMVIDSADLGAGGYMSNTTNSSRRLRNVLAHEIGHGIGFDHVDPTNATKLMEAFASSSYDGPQFDDMYTITRNYGDFFEKGARNDTAANAVDRGVLGGATDSLTNVSLSTTNDRDFYKFSLDATRDATISLTPTGPAPYLEGPQGGTTTNFDAVAQMDLQLELLASNGTTVLGTANLTGVGAGETLTMIGLAAGTYYIRVSPASGAADNNQMYTLTNAVTGGPVIKTTVALTGGLDLSITDTAAGGKTDTLSVTADVPNTRYVITDPINFIGTSIAGATGNGTHTVHVPFAAVTGGDVSISLGAGNDTLSVTTATVPFALDGGAGTDTINVLDTGAGGASIVSSTGNDTINVNTDNVGSASVSFPLSQTIGTLAVGSAGIASLNGVPGGTPEVLVVKNFLKITSTGKLDLKNNDLALNSQHGSSPIGAWNGSNYKGVLGLIKSGRNNGLWNSGGLITSQSLASGPFALTTLAVAEASTVFNISGTQTALYDGQTVDASTVLVKYTFAGDADLQDAIDGDDYFRIDQGYVAGANGWYAGDFNYSGMIDVDDYFLLDSNYNNSGTVLT